MAAKEQVGHGAGPPLLGTGDDKSMAKAPSPSHQSATVSLHLLRAATQQLLDTSQPLTASQGEAVAQAAVHLGTCLDATAKVVAEKAPQKDAQTLGQSSAELPDLGQLSLASGTPAYLKQQQSDGGQSAGFKGDGIREDLGQAPHMSAGQYHLALVSTLIRLVHVALAHSPAAAPTTQKLPPRDAARIRRGLTQLLQTRGPWQLRLGSLLLASFYVARIGVHALLGMERLRVARSRDTGYEAGEKLLLVVVASLKVELPLLVNDALEPDQQVAMIGSVAGSGRGGVERGKQGMGEASDSGQRAEGESSGGVASTALGIEAEAGGRLGEGSREGVNEAGTLDQSDGAGATTGLPGLGDQGGGQGLHFLHTAETPQAGVNSLVSLSVATSGQRAALYLPHCCTLAEAAVQLLVDLQEAELAGIDTSQDLPSSHAQQHVVRGLVDLADSIAQGLSLLCRKCQDSMGPRTGLRGAIDEDARSVRVLGSGDHSITGGGIAQMAVDGDGTRGNEQTQARSVQLTDVDLMLLLSRLLGRVGAELALVLPATLPTAIQDVADYVTAPGTTESAWLESRRLMLGFFLPALLQQADVAADGEQQPEAWSSLLASVELGQWVHDAVEGMAAAIREAVGKLFKATGSEAVILDQETAGLLGEMGNALTLVHALHAAGQILCCEQQMHSLRQNAQGRFQAAVAAVIQIPQAVSGQLVAVAEVLSDPVYRTFLE